MRPSILDTTPVQERIILVNSADEEIGCDFKADAHRGDGRLHRAFSVYLFDANGCLLLQQRSDSKPLWPGFWSNSCCSHPRPGETAHAAASRRVREELGLEDVTSLNFLFKFQYHARFDDSGAEHELCSVFAAVVDQPVRLDPHEVAAVRYMPALTLDHELRHWPRRFTPWLHLAWAQMRAGHWDTVTGLVSRVA